MKISVGLYGATAHQIALVLIQGFNRHYRLFRETCSAAKRRFEHGDWPGVHRAVKERIRFYDDRVYECIERLRNEFAIDTLDDATWQQVKQSLLRTNRSSTPFLASTSRPTDSK